VWWRGEEHVERILIDHFSDIVSSSNPVEIEEVCEVVRGKLNSDHKEVCASIVGEEVLNYALEVLNNSRSPKDMGRTCYSMSIC